MSNYSCILCGAALYEPLFSAQDADRRSTDVFHVVRCLNCGFASTYPFLDDKHMSKWYRSRYHGWWQSRPALRFFSRIFPFIRSKWVMKFICSGKLLDVGCGDGSFLSFMSEKGFNVFGLENTDEYIQASQNYIESSVQYSTHIWDYPEGVMDVVTLWHVLEHVENPLKMLERTYDILADTGYLIVSVPNFDSLQSLAGKDKWFHLDVPRHRWHFTPETIQQFLKKAGFSIIRLTYFSLEYNPAGWWQTILNMSGCTHNFIYNLFKRKEIPKYKKNSVQAAYDSIFSFAAGGFAIPAAFFLAYFEAAVGCGGSICITARKNIKYPTL